MVPTMSARPGTVRIRPVALSLRAAAIAVSAVIVAALGLPAGATAVAATGRTTTDAVASTAPAAVDATSPASTGTPHTVTFDRYSLKIDGKRTFIWSGEFHSSGCPAPACGATCCRR